MEHARVIDIPLHQDDRGSVYCIMDSMHNKGIKRTYVVENLNKGQIRAWHGHNNGTTYMHVISGVCRLVCRVIDPTDKLPDFEAVLSARKPQIFVVPPGRYNGAESLTDGTRILVYSTLSFDEVKKDDIRLEWNSHPSPWGVKNR
jgi:dTDP-4-dehydrorhamnose 3,5-epimerase-like enzyme